MSETVERVLFTEEMRKTHTILIPDMLPRHFKLIAAIMRNYGYKVELLQNCGAGVTENGLKYVHNDSCYPAQLVIGQFIDAIKSGKLGVMDYYKIQNLNADTSMRKAIAGETQKDEDEE